MWVWYYDLGHEKCTESNPMTCNVYKTCVLSDRKIWKEYRVYNSAYLNQEINLREAMKEWHKGMKNLEEWH